MVVGYDVPVHCGDVIVNPGDLIFADFDGIVVIPNVVEAEVFQRAKEKVDNEAHSLKELLDGHFLREIYDKYKSF